MNISVRLRTNPKSQSKIAAFADVVLELPDGKIDLNSFSVFKPNSKPAWVAPAASKGDTKWFRHYSLDGELRKRVEASILTEFEKQTSAAH